jgi:hypothetical protein
MLKPKDMVMIVYTVVSRQMKFGWVSLSLALDIETVSR